jgi:hypothetical protein
MAAITEIDQILVKAVQDGGLALDSQIAFENFTFDKNLTDFYLAIFNLRSPTVMAELGLQGCDMHQGVFQLDINYKQGNGMTEMLTKADEVNAVFKNGATFAGANESVNITNVTAEPVVTAQGWATVSMTINYYCFTQRVQ